MCTSCTKAFGQSQRYFEVKTGACTLPYEADTSIGPHYLLPYHSAQIPLLADISR